MSTDVDGPSPGTRVLRPATPPATEPAPAPPAAQALPPTPTAPVANGTSDPNRSAAGSTAAENGPDPRPLAPVRRQRGDGAGFRRPTSHRPLPPSGRMLALCAWATGIGALGLAVALRGLDAILAHAGPAWYEPTLAGVGLAAVVLTGAAFLSAERMRLPWIMLGLATVPVVVNLGLTIGAL